MTDLRQAAQQALAALEGWSNHGKGVWPESALEQAKRNTTEAIAALEAALAAPQPEPAGTAGDLFTNAALVQFDLRPSTKVYITHPPEPQPDLQDLRFAAEKPLWEAALRQVDDDVFAAYAEPQSEPVAWRWLYDGKPEIALNRCSLCFELPLPDADVASRGLSAEFPRTVQLLYAAQPQRQPLTEEQIEDCYKTVGYYEFLRPQDRFLVIALTRAIEKALGIGGDK